MPPPVFYVFECTVSGSCNVEFWLNDIPVVRRGPELGVQSASQSNHLMRDGVNEIAMVIEPGPVPTQALTGEDRRRERRMIVEEHGPAEATAALTKYPYGAIVGGPSREVLLEIKWEADHGRPEVFPRVITGSVELGSIVGRWAWQDAEPIQELSDEDKAGIHAVLEELQAAFRHGDPEPFIEHSRVRLEEISRAYNDPPDKKLRQIRAVTKDDTSKPDFGMEPLPRDEYDFRVCGNGRLVECVDRGWAPVLREKERSEDGTTAYAMLVSKIDGAWRIVR